jgi:RNA polymerase sigma-70 factor, ECF subfamily
MDSPEWNDLKDGLQRLRLCREVPESSSQADLEAALLRLFMLIEGIVFDILRQIGVPKDRFDDYLQEFFVRFIRAFSSGKVKVHSLSRFKALTYRICYNLHIDWFRKQKRHDLFLETKKQEQRKIMDDEGRGDTKKNQIEEAKLSACLKKLPQNMQDALKMAYFDDFPLVQIAQKLGVSPSTAGRMIEDALRRLREMLA